MEKYRDWLRKAKDDIKWTKNSIEGGIFYGACFSAQQAAEKALKCFLIFHNQPLRKVHDLASLLDDCAKIDPKFNNLRKEAKILYPYYIETRYPDFETFSSFTEKQAKEALEAAKKIIEFVEKEI